MRFYFNLKFVVASYISEKYVPYLYLADPQWKRCINLIKRRKLSLRYKVKNIIANQKIIQLKEILTKFNDYNFYLEQAYDYNQEEMMRILCKIAKYPYYGHNYHREKEQPLSWNWRKTLKRWKKACKDGDLELVQSMISKCDNDWVKGLKMACFGGNLFIVKLIFDNLEKKETGFNMPTILGASDNNYHSTIRISWNDWDDLLYYACCSGDLETVRLIMKKRGNNGNLGRALRGACLGGNLEIIQLIIEEIVFHNQQSISLTYFWNEGLYGACENGSLKLVKMLIQRGANDWGNGLYWACKGKRDNPKLVKLLLENATVEYGKDFMWQNAFNSACGNGFLKSAKIILKMAVSDKSQLINCFKKACETDNIEIVRLLMKKINHQDAWNANIWNFGLLSACNTYNLELAELMIQNGAKEWYHALNIIYRNKNERLEEIIKRHMPNN